MVIMRKNNAWNRLFHKAEVQKNVKQMSIYTKQCLEGQRFLDKIEGPNTLINLMNIHKDAWGTGFQNENIGPCPYGVFRTLDIPSMTRFIYGDLSPSPFHSGRRISTDVTDLG